MTAPLAASYLTLASSAFQLNNVGTHNSRVFSVLCGDNPPTIVDGYGQWTTIPRPLRQGVTVPQGFNPAKLKIEVRFGVWDGMFGWNGWDTRPQASAYVEECIDDLHWMAGGNSPGGPSPSLYIDSYRPTSGGPVRTNLMPPQYRGVPWIIDSGINWNDSLRDKFGSRIYQDADFTVTGYTAPSGGPPAVQKPRAPGAFVKVTAQTRTAMEIATKASWGSQSWVPAFVESQARSILKNSSNNPCKGTRLSLERRSIHWPIPIGTDVWVPPKIT